jgi:type I restriction enzyme R subunit
VLTDEAHRTQYGGLAGNMRVALPNAAFFGFTGTPIDKKDKSTLQTFGGYIDQYTIEQAVADGATVPIFYEGRLPSFAWSATRSTSSSTASSPTAPTRSARPSRRSTATEQTDRGSPQEDRGDHPRPDRALHQVHRPNGFKAPGGRRAPARAAVPTKRPSTPRRPAVHGVYLVLEQGRERLVRHHTERGAAQG